jgi:hypothetical protein
MATEFNDSGCFVENVTDTMNFINFIVSVTFSTNPKDSAS